MSKKKPEEAPNIQMTPVEFSPASTKDAIGNVGGSLPMREMEFPVSFPLAIILATLIFSTVRDISTFNRGTANIERANAPAEEMLKKASNLTDRVDSLRDALLKLSETDPVAAQIYKEYYPAEKKDNQDGQAGAASAPAK
jgi:hypothetical protein